MGKILTTYSKEIKEKAVRLYLEEGMGSTTIAKELGIPSHKIVMRWVRHFQNEGLEGLEEKRGKSRGFRKGRPRKHPMSLEEENIRLRAENDFLKKWLGLERR
jgi:transposase